MGHSKAFSRDLPKNHTFSPPQLDGDGELHGGGGG